MDLVINHITLFVTAALAALVMFLICWRIYASQRRYKTLLATVDALQKESNDHANQLNALKARSAELGEHLKHTRERQDQLEQRETLSRTYDPAIQLAHKGADVDELISACGLSKGEAELIMMLHRNSAAHTL